METQLRILLVTAHGNVVLKLDGILTQCYQVEAETPILWPPDAKN